MFYYGQSPRSLSLHQVDSMQSSTDVNSEHWNYDEGYTTTERKWLKCQMN